MIFLKKLKRLLFICWIFLLQSCFLVKSPVGIQTTPIKDTVNVYHFIVTNSSKKIADTSTTNSFSRESKKAFDWLSKEAYKRGQNLIFKEQWLVNKDTLLQHNFVHKLPTNNVQTLLIKRFFKVVTRKKTKTQDEKIERVDWNKTLFDSLAKQINDTSVFKVFDNKVRLNQTDNKLFMVHLLKAKKSRILGFNSGSKIFIGDNKSATIAHETLHYLGAPDLYIHRFWFGKRRRIVKKRLQQEIMDFPIGKNIDCRKYYISNYTAYTLNWDKSLEKQYKPILKQNLMAKFIFFLSLLF